ncbi:MAG: glucose-6-phosphate isomerase family protein [Patescibacteria group bacterium]|nr:glucose-6-phosphate isomerase family protein [Patescibacteria group bacterium]
MSYTEKITAPFGVDIDLVDGAMPEADRRLVRRASDMRGYYANEAALARLIEQGDPVHYEVFEKTIPEERGHLLLCISKLYPGQVGDECFMTKGHYHTISATAEVYLCLQGIGYMLMKTADGRCAAEPMARGRMVYVPPHWAHRSVNTGDEPLVSFCVYPAEAGHNYGDIATEGFPTRVFKRSGSVVMEP